MSDRDVFQAMENIVGFWSGDWSADKRLAWMFGIIAGWDGALQEVADLHGWDSETQARLCRHRREYLELKGLNARVAELEAKNELLTGVNKDQAVCIANQNDRVSELEAAINGARDEIVERLEYPDKSGTIYRLLNMVPESKNSAGS